MASNAQYVIDIAAQMTGGEKTLAELDTLTADLTGAGKGAEHFQQAIAEVSTALDVARLASEAANVALAKGEDEYATLERAALQAAKAAEKAALKGVIPPDVAKSAADASAAVTDYAKTLEGLEREAKKATREEEQLGKTLSNVRQLSAHTDKSFAAQAESLSKLRGGLNSIPGPAGKLGSSLIAPIEGFSKLSSSMGASEAATIVGVAAFAALAVAVVAVGVAVVAATINVAAWAVGLADSARSAELSQEALEAMHPELVALRGDFAALTDETGLSQKELNGLAKNLTDAKVSAEDMPAALRAAAIAESALGQGGSAEFISNIKDAKGAVGDLASEVTSKLGGVVARQMLGLESQSERFGKVIGETFGGLNIEPVLEGLQRLVSLFDQNTAAGAAMKTIFEGVFQPLIDGAETASLVIEAFALGFLIGLTKVYIAIKPAIKAVEEFFGFEDNTLIDVLTSAKDIGEVVAYVFTGLAVVFGLVVAAIAVAAGVVGLFVAAILAVPAAIGEAAAFINGVFISAITSAIDFIKSVDFAQIGADILAGLASGITGASHVVVDAVKNAISGAIASAKSILGIASPSKVFAGLGDMTGEGFVEGVEAQNDNAQAALGALVEPPDAPMTALAAQDAGTPAPAQAPATAAAQPLPDAPAGGSSDGKFAGAQFNFYGVEGAEDALARFEEMLTLSDEALAAKLGGKAAA